MTQKLVKLKKKKKMIIIIVISTQFNKLTAETKTKHLQAETKITDLTIKAAQISEKGHDFLLG